MKNKTNKKFVDFAINIFKEMKMNISFMDPESQINISHMSHLSHISSFMLGKTVIEKKKMKRIFLIWLAVDLNLQLG